MGDAHGNQSKWHEVALRPIQSTSRRPQSARPSSRTLYTLGFGICMPKKFRVANDRPHATRSALLPVAQSRKSTETNPMNKPPSTVGHAVVSRGKGQGMNEGLQVSGELRQVHGQCGRQAVKMARGHSDEQHAAMVVVAAQSENGGRMRTVNFEKKTFSSNSATWPTKTHDSCASSVAVPRCPLS